MRPSVAFGHGKYPLDFVERVADRCADRHGNAVLVGIACRDPRSSSRLRRSSITGRASARVLTGSLLVARSILPAPSSRLPKRSLESVFGDPDEIRFVGGQQRLGEAGELAAGGVDAGAQLCLRLGPGSEEGGRAAFGDAYVWAGRGGLQQRFKSLQGGGRLGVVARLALSVAKVMMVRRRSTSGDGVDTTFR